MIDVDETDRFLAASSWTQGGAIFDAETLEHLRDVSIPVISTTAHAMRFVPRGFGGSDPASRLIAITTLEPCGSCFFLETCPADICTPRSTKLRDARLVLRFRPEPEKGWRTKDLRFFTSSLAILIQDRALGGGGPRGEYESRVLLSSFSLSARSEGFEILAEAPIPSSQVDGVAIGETDDERRSESYRPLFVTDQMNDKLLVFDLVARAADRFALERSNDIDLPPRSFPHGIDYDRANDTIAVACLGPNHVLLHRFS